MVGDTVWLALIAATAGAASPVLLSYLTNRNRRQEKAEDYARQDAVAQKAAEAARLLKVNTAVVAQTAVETKEQLQVIHTLVNSNLTKEMKDRLAAMKRELVSLLEIVELKKALHVEPTNDAMTLIDETRHSVGELEIILNERLKATEIAAAGIKTEPSRPDSSV